MDIIGCTHRAQILSFILLLDRLKSLVQLLILHNADPNVQDARYESPLHLAAENGQPDITEMLLHSRVNLSLTDQVFMMSIATFEMIV